MWQVLCDFIKSYCILSCNSPILPGENQAWERLFNLSRVTELIRLRAGVPSEVCLTTKTMLVTVKSLLQSTSPCQSCWGQSCWGQKSGKQDQTFPHLAVQAFLYVWLVVFIIAMIINTY